MKTTIILPTLPLFLATALNCQAIPLEDWVSIFDPQANNPRFLEQSAETASPVTAEADQDSIASNFAPVTLTDGLSITLSGTVTFDVALAGDQFRVGLFKGDPVAQDVGNSYTGIYTEAPTINPSNLKYGDGTSSSHPFQAGTIAAEAILPGDESGVVDPETPITFSLTIARDGDNLDITTSYSDGQDYNRSGTVEDLDIQSIAPGFDYTFNTASFLLGGSMDGSRATFADIDLSVTTVSVPPLSITRIERSSTGDMVTLEWNSQEGDIYTVSVSRDLETETWEQHPIGSIEADVGDTTTRTFDLSAFPDKDRLFFRVEN